MFMMYNTALRALGNPEKKGLVPPYNTNWPGQVSDNSKTVCNRPFCLPLWFAPLPDSRTSRISNRVACRRCASSMHRT
jgi:hypothetical protein